MFRNLLRIGLTASLFGVLTVSAARADEWNKRTIVTFNQPVEVAGHVLPPGSYVFQLADSSVDRHIVQIFSADGRTLIATVLTIPDYRLTPTDEAVMKFSEVTRASNAIVPALAGDVGEDVDTLKTAPIVAVTPDAREMPVSSAIQTTPDENMANAARHADRLPKTASRLPEIALFGLGSILAAGAAMCLGRRAPAPVVM